MRVGLIAPLAESVPPALYGGTERVVAHLANELVNRGHDVVLFASGDSSTAAQLVPIVPRALRLDEGAVDAECATLFALKEAYARAAEFDVIHSHLDWFGFPFAELVSPSKTITTLHGRLDLPEIQKRHRLFPSTAVVAISHNQRRFLPDANWLATVYNGIDLNTYQLRDTAGDYLVFLGRICPDKGPLAAIEVARRTGMRLVIAAKVDPVDRDYFEAEVLPAIRKLAIVEFVGEVTDKEKNDILGGACAYLFPVNWPEPFGLTMVESMATGTPVISLDRGSVREIVLDGITGFICESVDEMVDRISDIPDLDRSKCRQHVNDHFTVERMVNGYEEVYRQVTDACDSSDARVA